MNPYDATTPDDTEIDPYTGKLKRVELKQDSIVISPLNRKLLYTKAEVDAKIAASGGGGGGSGVTSVNTRTGDVVLTSADVNLGNVDNTSDATKNGATATLSNKRLTQRVVALTDGATITVSTDTTDIGYVTLGGNRTIVFSGTPNGGDKLIIRLKQDATGSRTVTWPASVRWSTDLPVPTLTTTTAKTDYIGFMYNAVDATWDGVAVNRGF